MKVVVLIPARSGSKRIPHKNIKPLAGALLMAWSILTGRELGYPVYVSTDSRVYSDIAREWGAEVIDRPAELCTDKASDYEVISHALTQVEADLVVYLRPTTPFRSASVVQGAVKLMSFSGGYDSLRSVEPMSESAFKCFRIKQGILRPLTKGVDLTDRPNQELEQTYKPNGYVDIVRREIVERGALWGAGRFAYCTARVPELDTLDDWDYAEWWANKKGRGIFHWKS